MANVPEVFTTDTAEAYVEAGEGGAGKHLEPSLLGLEPYQIVSIAMLVLLLIAFFAKAHKTIAGGLDARIVAIRTQLDEAKALRAEAEALREEYAGKILFAERDAEAMIASAEAEAAAMLENARREGEAMVLRRQRMAEDKIAGAEREAIAEVRAHAAQAAAGASRLLIAQNHSAQADRRMTDEVIGSI